MSKPPLSKLKSELLTVFIFVQKSANVKFQSLATITQNLCEVLANAWKALQGGAGQRLCENRR
ncbi:hypothetical protein [Collimonas arenae]|uniref:hypothetical protein n=1 Tax=Collimonas arenae TaxID=279058 RepID=UPI0012E0653C|nr:hypothetical protein [Collimonas arenae]